MNSPGGDRLDGPEGWRDRRELKLGFSEREDPWSNEEIVLARNMACDGKSIIYIAKETGRTVEAVVRIIEQDAKPRLRHRQASVGFGHLKEYYR